MRDLDDEIQVVHVESHYDFAAAGRCGSRDHRAEMKRIKSPTHSSGEHRSVCRRSVPIVEQSEWCME